MKLKLLFICLFALVCNSYSQEKKLPQGWDEVILEGKPAYMNLITGDIITNFPSKPALKKVKVAEYDPTQIHIVKKGETLSVIARKYNLSLAEMYRLNSVENFDKIKIGQEIVVGYNEKTIEPINEKYTDTTTTDYHTVVSGETLYRIAKNYNISVSQLKSLNNLTNNIIAIGQELKVK